MPAPIPPPFGTEDDTTDVHFHINETVQVVHMTRPYDPDDRRSWYGRAYCGRSVNGMEPIDPDPGLSYCDMCLRSLEMDAYTLGNCSHCGGYVLGYRNVAGIHGVVRIGREGVYRTRSVCPGTWHSFYAEYIPEFPIIERGQQDDPADPARDPEQRGRRDEGLHRPGARGHGDQGRTTPTRCPEREQGGEPVREVAISA